MSSAASVAGRDRLRLFCALRLPDGILDEVAEWQDAALPAAKDIRLVPRENLHVTLAFLGSRPASDVGAIVAALREACRTAGRMELVADRYRETRSVGMLVLRDLDDGASALARDLHDRLEHRGVYERERREWLPHLTLIRFRRPPALAPSVPELGRFSPSDAALYTSSLRRSGAQYEVLESVALGG